MERCNEPSEAVEKQYKKALAIQRQLKAQRIMGEVHGPTYEEAKKEVKEGAPIETCFGPIKRFEIPKDWENEQYVWCLGGKRRTGKSHFAIKLIEKLYSKFDEIRVFSNTDFNGFWQQWIPPQFIKEYTEDGLWELLNRQRERITTSRKMGRSIEDARADNRILVILDDIIGANKYEIRYGRALSEIATAGRHYGITLIITTQHIKAVAADFRGNIDIMVVFNQVQEAQMKAIYENYLNFMQQEIAYSLIKDVAIEVRDVKHKDELGTELFSKGYMKAPKIVRTLIIMPFANEQDGIKTLAWHSWDKKLPKKKFCKRHWNNQFDLYLRRGDDVVRAFVNSAIQRFGN